MSERYQIEAARDGGFLVTEVARADGLYNATAFAGSLRDCLDYIGSKLAPEPAEMPNPLVRLSREEADKDRAAALRRADDYRSAIAPI